MKKYGSIEVSFDGACVVIYEAEQTIVINCKYVASLKVDSDGTVWITCDDDYFDLRIGRPEASYFMQDFIKHINRLHGGRDKLTQLQIDNAQLEHKVLLEKLKKIGDDK